MARGTWVSCAAILLALAAAPAAAQDQAFRVRLGLFTPDLDSEYYTDKERDFTGDLDDLEDMVGGVDYEHRFGERVSLLVSADLYEGQVDQSYRDFVDGFGDDIFHTTTLEIIPFTAGVKVELAPARSPVKPYVGAGGGLYTWLLEESGDFIDFGSPGLDIFDTTLSAEGAVFGYYLQAGLDVPLGPYFSLFAEGRWDRAEDELGDDFEGFGDIDLSGRRVMGGLAWKF